MPRTHWAALNIRHFGPMFLITKSILGVDNTRTPTTTPSWYAGNMPLPLPLPFSVSALFPFTGPCAHESQAGSDMLSTPTIPPIQWKWQLRTAWPPARYPIQFVDGTVSTPLLGCNLLAWYVDLTRNKGHRVDEERISCVKIKLFATTEKTTLTSYIPAEVYLKRR